LPICRTVEEMNIFYDGSQTSDSDEEKQKLGPTLKTISEKSDYEEEKVDDT